MTKAVNKLKSFKCKECSEIYNTLQELAEHVEQNHEGKYLKNSLEIGVKRFFNPENNQWYDSIIPLIRDLKKLNLSKKQFWDKYGEKHLSEYWQKNIDSDPVHGLHKNLKECKQCGKEKELDKHGTGFKYTPFCSFSCSTAWQAQNTDRIQRAQKTIKEKRAIDPTFCARNAEVAYYTKKGHTEEEAKVLISERQRTFTLEKCIEKHGEEQGRIIWQERQEKWIDSMKKSGLHSGYSDVSKKLFDEISKSFPNLSYGENEKIIRGKTRSYSADAVLGKKIIEFYGNYWHANPKMYTENHNIRGHVAKDIWNRDAIREQELKDLGYDVLVIWEKDFTENPTETIDKIKNFLK